MDATAILESEITRIGNEIKALEAQGEALRRARLEIRSKRSEARTGSADDAAREAVVRALDHLGIAEEQAAEHERFVERHLAEQRRRLDALVEDLEAVQESRVV